MKPLLPRSVLLMLSGILLVLFAASPASGQTDSLPPSGSSITEPVRRQYVPGSTDRARQRCSRRDIDCRSSCLNPTTRGHAALVAARWEFRSRPSVLLTASRQPWSAGQLLALRDSPSASRRPILRNRPRRGRRRKSTTGVFNTSLSNNCRLVVSVTTSQRGTFESSCDNE